MLRRPIARAGRPGVVGTMARTAVVAGTATAVAGGVSRRQAAKAEQAEKAAAYDEQQAMAAAAPPPPPPPAPAAAGASADKLDQLRQLGALHEQGILTDEEFAAEKAKLLA